MPARNDTSLPSRYRDPELIAQGGMGEILRATDTELGREVAVKVLAGRFAADEGLRKRFQREALAAARLSANPNIVTIFDVGEHEGRPLIVMEYMPGGSLENRVKRRAPCPASQVLDWLEQVASALDSAHEAGVVHRDVKPGNLLLDERDHIHVADFGIASATWIDSFTQTGTVMGTAGYLSPEQALGERAGAASDRYSLAVVAWELLVGKRPFAAETPTAEAAAHAHAPIPSIHSANPSLPESFDAIFDRALAKDPAARYATAAEFVGDLRRALHDDAGDTWVEPAPPRTVVAAVPARRHVWPLAALVLLLVAAGIAAALLATRHHSAAPKARTILRTVTQQGTTVEQTVTAPAPQAPPTTTEASVGGTSAAGLNQQGYTDMNAGNYEAALPLLEQAVTQLQGTNTTLEAYADYNLAYTRFALGQCTDVMSLLDNSERIQGHRTEITHLRNDARKKGC